MTRNYLFLLILTFVCLSLILLNAEKNNSPDEIEIVVTAFSEDSTMQEAGARTGDVLLRYNGKIVPDVKTLGALKQEVESETVEVQLLRDNETLTLIIPSGQMGVYLKEYLPDHQFDRDAVIIEDLGKLDWGIGMENSFLGAVTRLEEKYGYGFSYEDLVGMSSYGFRTHFFEGWCPSSPDATCGWDCGAYILEALGYEFDAYLAQEFAEPGYEDMSLDDKSMMKIITESIDRGWPVIAIDLIEVPEWGLITGYQNGGRELICRTYFDRTREYDIAEKTPWVIYVIKDRIEVDPGPLYRKSLVNAKILYNTPAFKKYFSGIRALEEWITALDNEKSFLEMGTDQLTEVMHTNWWIYYSLWDARAYTLNYLSNNSGLFGIPEKKLQKIIDLYKEELVLLESGIKKVPSTYEHKLESWTEESRQLQIQNLKELLELEREVNLILLTI